MRQHCVYQASWISTQGARKACGAHPSVGHTVSIRGAWQVPSPTEHARYFQGRARHALAQRGTGVVSSRRA